MHKCDTMQAQQFRLPADSVYVDAIVGPGLRLRGSLNGPIRLLKKSLVKPTSSTKQYMLLIFRMLIII